MTIETDLTPAEVLRRLYNAARSPGNGIFHRDSADMTAEDAQAVIDQYGTYYDWLQGRVMKIDVAQRPLDAFLYDRDNGTGAAARALARP